MQRNKMTKTYIQYKLINPFKKIYSHKYTKKFLKGSVNNVNMKKF